MDFVVYTRDLIPIKNQSVNCHVFLQIEYRHQDDGITTEATIECSRQDVVLGPGLQGTFSIINKEIVVLPPCMF